MTLIPLLAGCRNIMFCMNHEHDAGLIGYVVTYLRFQIAMYDSMVTHKGQRPKYLGRESADKSSGESNKIIGLDQLVQVDAEELHSDAQMSTEIKVLCHLDNVVLFIGILESRLV